MPGAQLEADLWIHEYISPCDVYAHGVRRILAHRRTAYQEMYIVESGRAGKGLVLDGKWQSCTGDEFLYHEPLVHPACVAHGGPRSVLILGGGEGATIREALRWNPVERVVMVDIDGEVVDACREHLPEMHRGAFDDPRVELVIGDALDYLDRCRPEWDVIVSDLSDPIEHGPSFPLFTRETFAACERALRPGGRFVLQAGPVAPALLPAHARLVNTVADVFPHVAPYASHVPSYGDPWGFVIGGQEPIDTTPDPDDVDRLLAERTAGGLRMFDGRTLLGLLQPPRHVRDAIAAETTVYTRERPPTFFGAGAAKN